MARAARTTNLRDGLGPMPASTVAWSSFPTTRSNPASRTSRAGSGGEAIEKTFELADFVGSVEFVDKLVEPAEDMGHHPDLSISWNKVTVSITNHAAGGLTANDFELARRIDASDAPGMRIVYVVGTRPNLVKMAPVIAALRERFPDGRARSSTPGSTTTG